MSVSLYYDAAAASSTEGYGSPIYLGFWDAAALDIIAPVAVVVSPAIGTMTTGTPLVIDITDAIHVAYMAVFASFAGGAKQAIYRNGAFEDGYTTSTIAAITGGFQLTLRRDGGWPNGRVAITIDAVDSGGNVGA